MTTSCECASEHGPPKLVVVTGGPGAGKTAVLEIVRRQLCTHIGVLPESAGIVFGGGFPRKTTAPARRMAQRSIFHVQSALEDLVLEERTLSVALCDRGTLDGLAYWPGDEASFFCAVGSSLSREIRRYDAVIHLHTPSAGLGYNHENGLRIESAREAHAIDARIAEVWRAHPRRVVIDSAPNFLDKASQALSEIRRVLPDCCRERLH